MSSRHGDNTIPRSGAVTDENHKALAQTNRLLSGILVEMAEGVVCLQDYASGAKWPQTAIRILLGLGGAVKPPRPWRFDAKGKPLVEGDIVAFQFFNGDPRWPLIVGIAQPLTPPEGALSTSQALGTDPNRVTMRIPQIAAATGAQTAFMDVEVFTGENGTVEIRVGGSNFGEYQSISINGIAGTISVGAGAAEEAMLGTRFITDFGALLDDLVLALAAIPYGPSQALADMIANLESYKSTIVKLS